MLEFGTPEPWAQSASSPQALRRVLIEIEGGVVEAVCAEPAIRAYKATHFGQVEITVCSACCDLFRNHPAVSHLSPEMTFQEAEGFDEQHCLEAISTTQGMSAHLVDAYAQQLAVTLCDRTPWLCLDSFDMVRAQRFSLESLPHPRIAIAPGSDRRDKQWDGASWSHLCEVLEEKLGASIIQIEPAEDEFLGHGLNLVGRLGPREAATVLSCCDLLISEENGCLDLAAAVQTPHVAILNHPDPQFRIHAEVGTSVNGHPAPVAETCVESVLEAIVALCQTKGTGA